MQCPTLIKGLWKTPKGVKSSKLGVLFQSVYLAGYVRVGCQGRRVWGGRAGVWGVAGVCVCQEALKQAHACLHVSLHVT